MWTVASAGKDDDGEWRFILVKPHDDLSGARVLDGDEVEGMLEAKLRTRLAEAKWTPAEIDRSIDEAKRG
jgi:hypothetical protein